MRERLQETDWKYYNSIIESVRERYLESQNKKLVSMLSDNKLTQTERFWKIEEFYRKEARILNDCLGNLSRSNMVHSILLMCRYKMMRDKDLEGFSEELQSRIADL